MRHEVNPAAKEKISIACYLTCIYFILMLVSVVPIAENFSLLKLASIGIGGLLIITLFIGRSRICLNGMHFWLTAYMLVMCASLLISSSESAVEVVIGYIQNYAMIMLISMRVYCQREKRLIEWTWLLIGLIAVIMGITSSTTLSEENSRMQILIFGAPEDPNQFCGYFLFPVLYALDRIMERTTRGKWLYVLYLLLIMYVVFKTGSRGGLLAIVIPGVLYALFAVKGLKHKLKVCAAVLLVAILSMAVIFPLLPEDIQERYSVQQVQQDRGSGRFEIWSTLLMKVFESNQAIVTGYGINATADILQKAGFFNTYAHNQWIQAFCDQGLIGVAVLFMLFFVGMRRTCHTNTVVCCALIGMLALSMSLSIYLFKPFLNVLLMSAMTFEGDQTLIEGGSVKRHG